MNLLIYFQSKKNIDWGCFANQYMAADVVPLVNYWVYDLFSIELCVFPLGLPVTYGRDIYYRLICSAKSIEQANCDQWILCLLLHV